MPGQNTNKGMNRTAPRLRAGASCQTLTATGYGFARDVQHFRAVSELAQMLVRSAGAGANFLLNVGPTPQGAVAAPAVDRLTRIGSWLRGSGEGIYGIRGDGDTLGITVPAERRDGLITTIPLDFA